MPAITINFKRGLKLEREWKNVYASLCLKERKGKREM